MAEELHEREREIKAARGEIVDRNGVVLATNRTVCTISVIHSQIKDPQQTADMLSKELELDREDVLKKVEKVSSMEKIKTNVDKKTGDRIREYNLPGVKVDEDFKRYYPYDRLASRVLGFTGSDNQGIIGLEVKYEDVLKGTNGKILTVTDARGIEFVNFAFLGQFAETKRDTIFTTEYSMRTGMEAVYTLLNVDRGVPEVWGSTYDVRDLLNATVKLRDGKKITDMDLPLIPRLALKEALKKIEGTDLEKILKEYNAI